jgi:hypothetical protein
MSGDDGPAPPHNELLERLAETGPLGLAALVRVFGTAIGTACRSARGARAGPRRRVHHGRRRGGGGRRRVAACLGCGLTAFPLAMPATALLFGVALGLLDALAAPPARACVAGRAPRAGSRRRAGGGVAAGRWSRRRFRWLRTRLRSSYWRGRAKAALAPRATPRPIRGARSRRSSAPRAPASTGRASTSRCAPRRCALAGRGAEAHRAANRALALEPTRRTRWPRARPRQTRAARRGAAPRATRRRALRVSGSPVGGHA